MTLRSLGAVLALWLWAYASPLSAQVVAGKGAASAQAAPPAALTPSQAVDQLRGDFFYHTLAFYPALGARLGAQAAPSTSELPDPKAYFESVDKRLSALEPSLTEMTPDERIDHAVIGIVARNKLRLLGRSKSAPLGAPIGDEEYAWMLKNGHGIDETPQELHARGLALAAEIRGRMERIARELSPDKDLAAVLDELSDHRPSDDAELFRAYFQALVRARDFVTKSNLFDSSAHHNIGMSWTPANQRGLIAVAAYMPSPTFGASKVGTLWVTPTYGDPEKLKMHSFSRIASLVAHEAFPGHDLQYYNFRDPSISPVRHLLEQNFLQSINVEGYALYAEELMRKMGFFTRKEELMQLGMQLWRAYRIVVDTGFHTGTMTFQEVISTLNTEAFLPLPIARAEARRYAQWPTQAVTYMVGRLQIEDLKERYKGILGADYDEAQFHRRFMSFGPVRPSLIAPVMLEEARKRKESRSFRPPAA